jgi:superfamily II DNA or RNA helicase
MFELYGFQDTAINDLRAVFSQGYRRLLLQAPTGAGKTVIAAQIVKGAVDKFRQVIFLAHRRELVNQSSDKLIKFGVDHGILMRGEMPYGATDVQVVSIDTFRSRCITTNKLPGSGGAWPYRDAHQE